MDAATPLQAQDPPRRLPLNRLAGRVGLLLLAGLLFLSLFPALVAPFDASARLGQPLERPGDTFLLGTNDIGQDLLSELIWGVRVSLLTGLAVAFLSVLIGASVGLFTGYFSGWLSSILLSLTSLAQVLPFLPLVILISAYLGPSQRNIVLVLVLFLWAVPARLVHSRVLSIAREDYIESARALGSSDWRILWVHIWPGVRELAFIQFVLVAGVAILAEASLSFLGLGNPIVKSWGGMLYFARASGAFLNDAWRWWVLPPGLMISLTVISLMLIAFSLERRTYR
jgi:ABC-type dipeptide/oligopeptide/nickel transport system permease subunit